MHALAALILAASSLVVHEWGTFTTRHRPGGEPIAFAHATPSELPSFVYAAGTKLPALVRMETPITYFYADEPIDVEARVALRAGDLTEFYPRASRAAPPGEGFGEALEWRVRVVPEWHPDAAGARLPQLAPGEDDARGAHYFFARETDSALVSDMGQSVRPGLHEKFLFYRGVANFDVPRRVTGPAIVLDVADDLAGARLVEVADIEIAAAPAAALGAGLYRPIPEVARDLSDRLERDLVLAGLHAKEARAFVRTWERTYFDAPGVRVLHLLPREFTEHVLPLSISPEPREVVRVMVGRAEVERAARPVTGS